MFQIVLFLINLVREHIVWIYAACALGILINLWTFLSARRSRQSTIFPVEQEVAVHKEGRALSHIGLILGLVAVVTLARYYIVPSIDVTAWVEPTPTMTLRVPTEQPTPTGEPPTPTAEQTSEPTRPVVVEEEEPELVPTDTPTPVPTAVCADPNTCIISPVSGETLSGAVTIRGTANHPQFQFYKVEYGLGENPDSWHSIGDTVHSAVTNGTLISFDTRSLPNGVYWLKLTVVDITGNFPPPHRVRVTIEN